MTLISCENVTLSYDGNVAVEGVDCQIAAGDYLCIVGCNGSGKTTFIRGLLGLLKPVSGSIVFSDGLKRQDIGYLPQQSTVQKNFPASVREVVLSGRLSRLGISVVYRRQDKQAAREALELLQIADLEKSGFGELSGGQQQRVLLARALCAAPDGLKVLILDEPMNGLDAHAKTELYATISELNHKQGITVLMITHDVQAAIQHADRILVLEGKQEFYGDTHAFQHTALGRSMLRDSCGNNCAVCGIGLGDL
ncbi:MAG TPA: ABC transporter [Coriobacteriia bacterium]|nr:ABC transporter [Coriobacteriia bacterium]